MGLTPTRGDFVLFDTGGFLGALIRLGTRSSFNHGAIVWTSEGDLILEAAPRAGIRVNSIRSYGRDNRVFSTDHIPLMPYERSAILAKADSLRGVGYGYLDIVALALYSVTGLRWKWLTRRVMREDRLICSQYIAVCYAAAGITLVPGKTPQEVTPGDLALALLEWPAPAPCA